MLSGTNNDENFACSSDERSPLISVAQLVNWQLSNDNFDLSIVVNFDNITPDELITVLSSAPYQNNESFEPIIKALNKLKDAGFTFETDKALYASIIKNVYAITTQANNLIALKKAGFEFKDYQDFYLNVNQDPKFNKTIRIELQKLHAAGYAFVTHPEIYNNIANDPNFTCLHELSDKFKILTDAGFSYDDHKKSFIALSKTKIKYEKLKSSFEILKNVGFSFEYYQQYYDCIIEYPKIADRLVATFETLAAQKYSINKHKELCKKIAEFYCQFKTIKQLITNTAEMTPLSIIQLRALATDSLEELGYTSIEHPMPHGFITQLFNDYQEFALRCIELHNAGISYASHKNLYKLVFHRSHGSKNITDCYIAFREAGVSLTEHACVFETIGGSYMQSKLLNDVIKLLQSGNIFASHSLSIINNIKNNHNYINSLSIVFNVLNQSGFSINTHSDIYLDALESVAPSGNIYLPLIIRSLVSSKLAPTAIQALIRFHIQNPTLSDNTPAYNALHAAGVTFEQHEELYFSGCVKHCTSEQLIELLRTMRKLKISYKEFPEFFNQHLLTTNHRLTSHILSTLTTAGFNFADHQEVFEDLLALVSEYQVNHHAVVKATEAVCAYAKKHGYPDFNHPDFNQQVNAFENLIQNTMTSVNNFLQGPLNKSKATSLVEAILEKICSLNIHEHKLIQFNAMGHYILHIPDTNPINLSLLIQNANLSQLELSESLILKMGDLIEDLINQELMPDLKSLKIGAAAKLLPEAQQTALSIYRSLYYKNINRFFRSEPLLEESVDSVYCTLNELKHLNYLVCFLLGCLLNDAARKLNTVIDGTNEKQILERIAFHYELELPAILSTPSQYEKLLTDSVFDNIISQSEYDCLQGKDFCHLYPMTSVYDRGETLTADIIERRKANPWFLPALTSISARNEGSNYIHQRKNDVVRTVISNNGYFGVICDTNNEEVLLPHGECMLTTQSPEGLISTLIRSPSLERKNNYWSMLALLDAYHKHLSHEYKEYNSAITLGGEVIVRPNHDMSHAYRKMLNIEQVINYFKDYAIDPEFKVFCETLSDDAIEWLRVAAAFSVTGRECEVGAKDDLTRYERYKEASCVNFNRFVTSSCAQADPATLKRVSHSMRYMGNPHYQTVINNHPDLKERKIRNFYYNILTIAHNLDLARCKYADEYADSLELCRSLSINNPTQQQAYHELMQYNIALLKAHGCSLLCDITPNGELIDVEQRFQNQFAQASTNLTHLMDLTQSVPKPLRTPPAVPRTNSNHMMQLRARTNKRPTYASRPSARQTEAKHQRAEVFEAADFCKLPTLLFTPIVASSSTSMPQPPQTKRLHRSSSTKLGL